LLDAALAMAVATGVGDHLAAAMAARTGLLHREETLLHTHLTDAAAGAAGGRATALLGTGAATGLAVGQGRHANGHRRAAHRLFQAQPQGVAQVAAPLRAATLAPTGTPEEVAEHVTEDVGEAGAAGKARASATHLRIDTGMAVLIVGRALVGIGEHQ